MWILLKPFTWLCKIAAVVFWLWVALTKIELDIANVHGNAGPWGDPDWGTPAFYHRSYLEIATLSALAVLAILPNRWLVFSPISFAISLLVALIPSYSLLSSLTERSDLPWMAFPMCLFAPLPLSLILSFWRRRKGEAIGYV
jgi:hypothetical protein